MDICKFCLRLAAVGAATVLACLSLAQTEQSAQAWSAQDPVAGYGLSIKFTSLDKNNNLDIGFRGISKSGGNNLNEMDILGANGAAVGQVLPSTFELFDFSGSSFLGRGPSAFGPKTMILGYKSNYSFTFNPTTVSDDIPIGFDGRGFLTNVLNGANSRQVAQYYVDNYGGPVTQYAAGINATSRIFTPTYAWDDNGTYYSGNYLAGEATDPSFTYGGAAATEHGYFAHWASAGAFWGGPFFGITTANTADTKYSYVWVVCNIWHAWLVRNAVTTTADGPQYSFDVKSVIKFGVGNWDYHGTGNILAGASALESTFYVIGAHGPGGQSFVAQMTDSGGMPWILASKATKVAAGDNCIFLADDTVDDSAYHHIHIRKLGSDGTLQWANSYVSDPSTDDHLSSLLASGDRCFISGVSITSGGTESVFGAEYDTIKATGISYLRSGIDVKAAQGGVPATMVLRTNSNVPQDDQATLTSSDSILLPLPTNVSLQQGTSFTTFNVTPGTVRSDANVNVSSTIAGTTVTNVLTVSAPWMLGIYGPAAMASGTQGQGSVQINSPAPSGGYVVTLAGANGVTVPGSVTIEAGATSATFTITAPQVTQDTQAGITADSTLGHFSFVINITNGPLIAAVNCPSPYVVGGTTSTGTITFTKPPPDSATITMDTADHKIATVDTTATVSGGQVTFAINAAYVGGNRSVAVKATYSGITVSGTLNVNPLGLMNLVASQSTIPGGSMASIAPVLTYKAPPAGASVSVTSSDTSAVPNFTALVHGGSYYSFTNVQTKAVANDRNVILTALYNGTYKRMTVTVLGPTISTLQVPTPYVVGGTTSTGTITFGGAPTPSTVVTLDTSNHSVATVSSPATISNGKGTFAINTVYVNSPKTVTITATVNGKVTSTALNVTPVTVSSLSVGRSTIPGGQALTVTPVLTYKAPPGGLAVAITGDNPAVIPGATVWVAAGAYYSFGSLATKPVSSDTPLTLTASLNGSSKTATVTVIRPVLTSLVLHATTLKGGTEGTYGIVYIGSPAPAGGISVAMTSDDSAAHPSGPAMIAARATYGTFSIFTNPVTVKHKVTFSASYAGELKTAIVNITP